MPFEPLCFIHASNLSLDHPQEELGVGSQELGGQEPGSPDPVRLLAPRSLLLTEETGPLPDEIREIVEESTLTAYQRVIQESIKHSVDFVLLTGNSFDENDRSLRARIALLDGFHRLAEHDIRVFVLPGVTDPSAAWRAIPDVPDNVTTFFRSSGESVAVFREGKVIASVACSTLEKEANQHEASVTSGNGKSGRRDPFRVGVQLVGDEMRKLDLTSADADAVHDRFSTSNGLASFSHAAFDYLALGGPDLRRTIATRAGISHNPGSTQGWAPTQTGPHGCTLVKVDSQGGIQCKLIPTAPLRWESAVNGIEPDMSPDELVHQMRTLIGQCRPNASEHLWLVNWTFPGCGPLYESLQCEQGRRQLIDLFARAAAEDEFPRMIHRIRLLPDCRQVESARDDNRLANDYLAVLEHTEVLNLPSMADYLTDIAPSETTWGDRLRQLIDGLDHNTILGHARRLGIEQFSGTLEAESEN